MLDFKSLVKVRNDIAHSGLFRKNYTTDFITDLIYNHKLALQVILLKELEYDGLVVTIENKSTTYTKIEELKDKIITETKTSDDMIIEVKRTTNRQQFRN